MLFLRLGRGFCVAPGALSLLQSHMRRILPCKRSLHLESQLVQVDPCKQMLPFAQHNRRDGQVHLVDRTRNEILPNRCYASADADDAQKHIRPRAMRSRVARTLAATLAFGRAY
jgi:hypothetical protein